MKFTTRHVDPSDGFPISQANTNIHTHKTNPSDLDSEDQHQHHHRQLPQAPSLRRLHHFRTVVLPILLVLVFTTLILGSIYAYCVAKPHTDIADQLAQNSTAEADSSLFQRSASSSSPTSQTSTSSPSTSTTSKSESDSSRLALLFYTLTTPTTSIIHLFFEIVMHHNTPTRGHPLLSRRTIYFGVICLSSLLAAGWIANLSFWIHCELATSTSNHKSLDGSSNLVPLSQAICPPQIRGHFMYGIHEVSIAKAVVGGVVWVLYLGYIACLVSGLKAQKRVWRLTGSNKLEHGEAAEVDVEVIHVHVGRK
ncbi:hypothetical protein ABEF95_010676 [Exophiala dermatitidis]